MNKTELINKYAEAKRLTKVQASSDVDMLLEMMCNAVVTEGTLDTPYFKLKKKHVAERQSANPQNRDEKVTVPEHDTVKLVVCKKFKDMLNPNTDTE